MKSRLIGAVCACMFLFSTITSVQAVLLNYSISGVGSGMLGANAFNTNFTINMVGDTNLLIGIDINPLESASVTIDGLGTTGFLIPTRLGQAGTTIFFSRASGLDLFDFGLAAPVDLANPFGPVIGTNVFGLFQFVNVNTTLGDLTFLTSSDVNFQATLSSVPLPAALPLFATGLAVMGFVGWRRRRQQTAVAETICT